MGLGMSRTLPAHEGLTLLREEAGFLYGNTPYPRGAYVLLGNIPRPRGAYLVQVGKTMDYTEHSPPARGLSYVTGEHLFRGGTLPAREGLTLTDVEKHLQYR